jgi:hypothetical protein
MKYDKGITLAKLRRKMRPREATSLRNGGISIPSSWRRSTTGRRKKPSKMTKKTMGRRFTNMMLTPPTVYL